MISHIFYHQETVEESCAINSWLSIRDNIGKDDELIILDLGCTLTNLLPLTTRPKYLRHEAVRTDQREEKSYTYGLNLIMPLARNEWICLWRSDYIYHKDFFPAVKAGMKEGNVVLPYEAFIGAEYCRSSWCNKRLSWLMSANEQQLLKHSHACPVYEMMDFAHFAIKKELWMRSGGMNTELWGYGYQFPELFKRLKNDSQYQESIGFEMIAFHQNHSGSFGLGILNEDKQKELQESHDKLLKAFGNEDAIQAFKLSIKQEPLRPRRSDEAYRPKVKSTSRLKKLFRP